MYYFGTIIERLRIGIRFKRKLSVGGHFHWIKTLSGIINLLTLSNFSGDIYQKLFLLCFIPYKKSCLGYQNMPLNVKIMLVQLWISYRVWAPVTDAYLRSLQTSIKKTF